ncbi:MAG: phosphatase PAP2 family protein [Microscillaceae bacterium]|nr:phosphatase PAP2 family protein [Microscillaceae bacterium]
MFQTDIIQYIQSFASPWLTSLMQLITSLGYGTFYILFFAVITFGIDFRKGFLLIQLTMWTASINEIFKNLFALPRPYHVDSLVQSLDSGIDNKLDHPFVEKDAPGFFDPLPAEVLDYYKGKEIPYGLPSGHTSMTLTLYVVLMRLFSPLWVKVLSLSLIVLIPFSRMYLGVHFLADVLGGYLLGFVLLGVYHRVILRRSKLHKFLQQISYPFQPSYYLLYAYLLLSPFVMLIVAPQAARQAAFLVGINVGFLLIMRSGFPNNYASWIHRVLRVLIAILIFIAVTYAGSLFIETMGFSNNFYVQFTINALSNFIYIWGGVRLNTYLNLFGK